MLLALRFAGLLLLAASLVESACPEGYLKTGDSEWPDCYAKTAAVNKVHVCIFMQYKLGSQFQLRVQIQNKINSSEDLELKEDINKYLGIS